MTSLALLAFLITAIIASTRSPQPQPTLPPAPPKLVRSEGFYIPEEDVNDLVEQYLRDEEERTGIRPKIKPTIIELFKKYPDLCNKAHRNYRKRTGK